MTHNDNTLIVDCGGTKAHMTLISDGPAVRQMRTAGFNAVRLGDSFPDGFTEALSDITPGVIYHYGAGCIGGDTDRHVADLYRRATGCCDIHVAGDMLGAVRAVSRGGRAIVCILGTGSNSCLTDGRSIIDTVPPLGYILGDEGSGAVLGRRLAGDVFKRLMPRAICDAFVAETGLTATDVIRRVYRSDDANMFLGGLTRFIHRHLEVRQVEDMVIDEFTRFITRNVMQYDGAERLPVHFVGSVAYYFAPQLRRAVESCGLHIGEITADPMDGLVRYHTNHMS